MRALTLKPHWAHGVAHLGKRIENRSRRIPRHLVGSRIAIHAGASLPAAWFAKLWQAGGTYPEEPGSTNTLMAAQVVTRSIVATAVLSGNVLASTWNGPPERWADPAATWWWILADVRTLGTPVHCQRGQLGLWTLPSEVAEQLAP